MRRGGFGFRERMRCGRRCRGANTLWKTLSGSECVAPVGGAIECWSGMGNARYFGRARKSGVAVQIEFCGRANRVSLINSLYL